MSTIVVDNFTPTAGTALANSDVVEFDVTDATQPLVQVVIAIRYPGIELYEVVYDGAQFTTHYSARFTTVSSISNGIRFTLLRNPVWPDGVELHVFVTAADGSALASTTSWPLAPNQAATPPDPVVPIVYPTTGNADCDAVSYDEQHFLDMFDRLFPDDYLSPMKLNPNSGYEIFEAAAAVGERVSLAIERLECDSFVTTSAGASFATGTIQFWRPNSLAGSVTVKEGSIVTTSAGGRDFVTTQDTSFSASGVGPIDCPVRAVAAGYEWNVPGQRVTSGGVVIAGEIDTCYALVLDPAYGDPTIQVQQLLDTTGGHPPMLDGLGADRGILRQLNETDPHYALRIRSLPDTVSPDAIVRNLTNYLPPLGISFSMIETFDITYQTVYDAPADTIAANPDYDPSLFAYDRPANPYGPFEDRWLDSREDWGAFIIVVSQNNPIYDVSMAFDDTASGPTDLQNPLTGFQRGDSAYDVLPPYSFSTVFVASYDGFDLRFAAAMLGLEDLLQQIKAGGVAAVIEENGN